jgi:glycosyltransferase involved in cell wall biosynthesis
MKPPSGKRVLMLLENNSFQSDKRPKDEAQTLVDAGYHVSVISPRPVGGGQNLVMNGIRLYQFPPPPTGSGLGGYLAEYGYAVVVMSLLSLVVWAREGFDVLHVHNPPDTFFLLAAFYKLLGKRFVFDHHDLAPEMYMARYGRRGSCLVYQMLKRMEILTCRVADHVITTSESYAALERQRGKVPASQITVVRNGPRLESLQPVEAAPGLRHRARTLLGYTGRMGPQDGVDYLLRALHHLACDLGRTDFECVLVGGGDALPGLRALTTQLGLDDHVVYTGWVEPEKVAGFLSAADICVTPDPSNPYNDCCTMIKNMEYMALAKPVVAFDLPEHRITAQAAAVYARPNDELDFARKIALLMDDPERRALMGQYGRKRIETELAWPYQAKRLLEAYASLCPPEKTSPDCQ